MPYESPAESLCRPLGLESEAAHSHSIIPLGDQPVNPWQNVRHLPHINAPQRASTLEEATDNQRQDHLPFAHLC